MKNERTAQAQFLCNLSSGDGIMSGIPRQGKTGVSECETKKSKGTCRVRHYHVGITLLPFHDNTTGILISIFGFMWRKEAMFI